MNTEETHSFFRFIDALESRLDVLFNDELFDEPARELQQLPYPLEGLLDLADLSRDSCDPRENPDEEFQYVDIGSIDTTRAQTTPIVMPGREAISSRMRRVLYGDAVLLSTTRPTRNAICVVPLELDGGVCSTGLAVLRPKADVNPYYLCYVLRSRFTTWQLEKLCSGSGYPAINQETDLPLLRVPKPTRPVQDRMVQTVQPLEQAAQLLDSRAGRVRAGAAALLLLLLGLPTDLAPTYFKSGQETTSRAFVVLADDLAERQHYHFYHPRPAAMLAALNTRYSTTTLADPRVVTYLRRGEQPEYTEDGPVRVLKTIDLKNGYITYDKALRVSQEFFDAMPHAQVRKGDILLASTGHGSMGKVDIYDLDELAVADSHLTILRVGAEYDSYFVAYYLRSEIGQLQIEKWFTGSSGQIELQPDDIRQFLIPASNTSSGIPMAEQQRIAARVTKRLNWARALEAAAARRWAQARATFEEGLLQPSTP